jgi:hypothetical protein
MLPKRMPSEGISIVIPTLGRPSLKHTLDSLTSQISSEDEVIVVHEPGDAVTPEICNGYPFSLRVLSDRTAGQHERGDLTPASPPYTGIASGTRQQQEIRSFDETGNWLTNSISSPFLNQTRTHNKANEIASLTGPSGVVSPTHDLPGNLTAMPAPGNWTVGYALKWDAWNRLVQVTQGATVVASHVYDALTRRVSKTNPSETR